MLNNIRVFSTVLSDMEIHGEPKKDLAPKTIGNTADQQRRYGSKRKAIHFKTLGTYF